MTASAHSTTAEAAAQMPRTADPQHADDAPTQAAPAARAAASVGRRAWKQLGDNPLQALFGTAIVALLIFNFTATHDRIDDTNDRIDETNHRITRLEEKIDARFTALEKDVAEINLKLTALIASLNKTDEVAAALEGRIINSARMPSSADGALG